MSAPAAPVEAELGLFDFGGHPVTSGVGNHCDTSATVNATRLAQGALKSA